MRCHGACALALNDRASPLRSQALVPVPTSKLALLGKAAAIIASTLALATYIVWKRPFAPAHTWKGPVRVTLLILAAASAAVVAWAAALDLRLISGLGAYRTLTAGAYTLTVLFGISLVVLVASVAAVMLRGVKDEDVRIPTKESPSPAVERPYVDTHASPGPKILLPQHDVRVDDSTVHVRPAETVAAAAPDSNGNLEYALRPQAVRRLPSRHKGRRQQKPSHRDAGLLAAASTLADAIANKENIVDTCKDIATWLHLLSADEVRVASAALMPGLTARLEADLRGGVSFDSTVIEALFQAMAALSDHADKATLSRLSRSEAPRQLTMLLRHSALVLDVQHAHAPLPPALAPALWLLGNVVTDEAAAVAFTLAGGVETLATLLSAASAVAGPSQEEEGSTGTLVASVPISSAATLLHICVALTSISVHKVAAVALLHCGVIPSLSRCLVPRRVSGGSSEKRLLLPHKAAAGTAGDALPNPCIIGGSEVSLVDAEAACHALVNVLRTCASTVRDAALASSELAACGSIEGCTAALWRATSSGRRNANHCAFSTRAAEVLLVILECAAAASISSPDSSSAIATLVGQVTEAGTLAAAESLLLHTLESDLVHTDGRDSDEENETAGLKLALEALLSKLRPWLLRTVEDMTRGGGGADV